MKKSMWILVGASILTLGALSTASCGSSDNTNKGREGGGAGGEGGVTTPSPGGAPGSGGTGAALGIAGDGGAAEAGAGGTTAPGGVGGAGGAEEVGAAGVGGTAGGDGGAPAAGLRLFNTGVDDDGVVLPGGSVDPHYTLIQSPDATYMGPDAIVATTIAEGYWLPQSETSKWIAPTPDQPYPATPNPCNATGVYVWRTLFDLTGYDPATFRITGGWAADNYGTAVLLNGVVVTGITAGSYTPLSTFTIDSGFVAGVNTLDFEVTDVGCPNGLRVELSAETGAGGAGGAGSM